MKRIRQYLLGNKLKIQTNHRALIWLHNVKDPSSRLLRWRLRMEEYDYENEKIALDIFGTYLNQQKETNIYSVSNIN